MDKRALPLQSCAGYLVHPFLKLGARASFFILQPFITHGKLMPSFLTCGNFMRLEAAKSPFSVFEPVLKRRLLRQNYGMRGGSFMVPQITSEFCAPVYSTKLYFSHPSSLRTECHALRASGILIVPGLVNKFLTCTWLDRALRSALLMQPGAPH
jgi:hypothetical protein